MPRLGTALATLLTALTLFAVAATTPSAGARDGTLAAPARAAERGVTVILVRHAEKATGGDARDPDLSPAGEARAAALARLLGAAGVTHLYASEYKRTQATLAPLAAATKLTTTVSGAAKAAELADTLRALPAGSIAVVAGHSNTVPDLARRLGAPLAGLTDSKNGPVLPEEAFDRVYAVTLPPRGVEAAPTVLELRYGG